MIKRRALLLSTLAASGASAGCASAGPPPARQAAARPAGNQVVLSNDSGRSLVNWPLRFARPFRQGEIANAPGILIDGAPLVSQADIKTLWPDGSVRHAVLSCVVPRIPAGGTLRLSFADRPRAAPAGLQREQMLAPGFDFDAALVLAQSAAQGGQSQTASARAMLQAGDYTVWCQGPVATTIILADHSAARRYDMGFEPVRPVRPIFHATFWPSLNAVEVRLVAENACTEALQDAAYDMRITAGAAHPAEVMRQDGLRHYLGTRWTRRFWIGAQPDGRVSIDHGLAYLGQTTALPPYDTSITIPGRVVADTYAAWLKTPRGLYEKGGWTPYMPTTGGRDDIGHVTGPLAKWLYTGDWRLFEMVSTMADLAAAWPLHLREGKAGVTFDRAGRVAGLGRPVSVYGRPTLWQFDERDRSRPQDRVAIREPRLLQAAYPHTSGGWVADNAHTPDPYSALYLLSGDFFALEQLQFWTAAQAGSIDPGYRGVSGATGAAGIREQVRGQAWMLRSRAAAAVLSPDGTAEKPYYHDLVDDAVAFWEGTHGVKGTRFEGSRLWRLARTPPFEPFEPPLHVWADDPGRGAADAGLVEGQVSTWTGFWQGYFVLVELGSARDQGLPTQALLSWLAVALTGQFGVAGYDPTNLDRYEVPVRKADKTFFQSWPDTLPAYLKPPGPLGDNVSDGYASYGYAASTFLLREPGGQVAYEWLRRGFFEPNRARYGGSPKWAFLPRA